MQMDQLFRCELGEGAQTLHDLSSAAAAAGGRGYIMQKPGPPMLSSRHAEWYAAASHHHQRVRGSNRLAYGTVPQSELERKETTEKELEREREGGGLKVKEQKKQRGRGDKRTRGTKGKVERKIEEERDGRRNIHEGTHKRRQTETLQLQDYVFAETTRNRKGRFGWKGPVGQNRETSMCVYVCVCVENCVCILTSHCGLRQHKTGPQEIFRKDTESGLCVQ